NSRPGEANAINLGRTLAAVRTARRLARIVIVFVHWGTEGQECPDANQLSLAPKLAAAGASIIIGSHAHMLQGSGWLGHTFVAYGMANFLWWENSFSTATGILRLTVPRRGSLSAHFIPAEVSATGQPVLLSGAAARQGGGHPPRPPQRRRGETGGCPLRQPPQLHRTVGAAAILILAVAGGGGGNAAAPAEHVAPGAWAALFC